MNNLIMNYRQYWCHMVWHVVNCSHPKIEGVKTDNRSVVQLSVRKCGCSQLPMHGMLDGVFN